MKDGKDQLRSYCNATGAPIAVMCVKMLNPQEDEYMIDTVADSSGFPVHTIFHVWKQILEDEGNVLIPILPMPEQEKIV